jgi:hypothetical protein
MDCQAIKERKELTERIIHACNPTPDAQELLRADGSEKSLVVWGSILQGIIREYTDGGDQMTESCSCGEHQ